MRNVNFRIVIVLIFLLTGCSFSTTEDNLNIVIFKIGKADSILLTINEQAVLIDTGEDEDGEEIIEYMKKNKIDEIDYLIVTHFDKDHVGGADQILKEVQVSNVITPNYKSDSKQYKQFVKALEEENITPQKLTENLNFQLRDAEFTVNPPEKDFYSGDNDYSLVTSVIHGNNTFLFAGDAKEERLSELIDAGNLEHTFLKVPHHGRFNDKSEEFFNLVNPKYAVITSSDKNPEEDEVMEALEHLGTEVYVTRKGNIEISSDGETIHIKQ